MLETTIEAVYENGYFKPLSPVNLPEGTRVRLATEISSIPTEDQIRQRLIAGGCDQAAANRILDNFHLLWESYDSLSSEQQLALEQARLDQEHFFDHTQ